VLILVLFSVGICRKSHCKSRIKRDGFAATIPKFVNQLSKKPPVYASSNANFTVFMTEFFQQMLPIPLPRTKLWGYGGLAKDESGDLRFVTSSPGPTFEVQRGQGIFVTFVNNISQTHMFPVDPTLHWANPNNMPMMFEQPMPLFPPGFPLAQQDVPLVPHLHGGETVSSFDGHPDAWFTFSGKHGATYASSSVVANNSATYHYTNGNAPSTLWYHDHALGLTRLNVVAGLAGFYIVRDALDNVAPLLPSGKYEWPLLLQDKMFNEDGSILFPSDGENPTIHPYWIPEYFGDVILVNGLVWPNMNVDRGQYFFRLLDGSNARFFNLTLVKDSSDETFVKFVIVSSGIIHFCYCFNKISNHHKFRARIFERTNGAISLNSRTSDKIRCSR
jgi:spore coat protein A